MSIQTMALIGTGVMGMGIAQIAALAGIQVRIYDAQAGAACSGLAKLKITLEKLQLKAKISEQQCMETLARITVLHEIEEIRGVDLVVEAIIENLDIKQGLFQQLERIVSAETILATNTSSLSITSIAAELQYPNRFAGFHFFNPVPLMKIVEVIAGLNTDESVITKLLAMAKQMGHQGVRTQDTPGFIVNHAGRAYGTEALKILSEAVTSVSEIDRILREGVGFRMGPFELLDLTALDVSHPVMESIYNQYYQEDRYRPSDITRQMLAAKKLGRKVGEGFYKYVDGKKVNEASLQIVPEVAFFNEVWLKTDLAADADILKNDLLENGFVIDLNEFPKENSLILLASYGEDTTTAALRFGVDPSRSMNIDMLTDFNKHRTLMPSIITQKKYTDQSHAIFSKNNHSVSVIAESIGFVSQRVLAMVINLACDIAQQHIATAPDIDQAVKLGLGYPYGPISWGDHLGANRILMILERILENTGDQRYRPSPWLKRRAQLNLSLLYSNA